MARSIAQWYDTLIGIKEADSTLNGLTPLNDNSQAFLDTVASGATSALWRLWTWLFATGLWVIDVLIDTHKEEVAELLRTSPYGTLPWYHRISLEFQYGFELLWNGTQYVYTDTTSETALEARRVRFCSVLSVGDQLQFKVAGADETGKPIKLANAVKTSYEAYLNDMVYPGTNYVVISEDADELRLFVTIYFDPLVLNPDGSSIADSSVYPVVAAINSFVQNLPFNGRLNVQRLVDAIQAVPGVADLLLNESSLRYGGLPYQIIERETVPFAGHMVLNETDSVISYEVYV